MTSPPPDRHSAFRLLLLLNFTTHFHFVILCSIRNSEFSLSLSAASALSADSFSMPHASQSKRICMSPRGQFALSTWCSLHLVSSRRNTAQGLSARIHKAQQLILHTFTPPHQTPEHGHRTPRCAHVCPCNPSSLARAAVCQRLVSARCRRVEAQQHGGQSAGRRQCRRRRRFHVQAPQLLTQQTLRVQIPTKRPLHCIANAAQQVCPCVCPPMARRLVLHGGRGEYHRVAAP